MNVFEAGIAKVFVGAHGVQNLCRSETAISCLALFIEQGRKCWQEAFKNEGYDFELEVIRYLHCTGKEKLPENKIIVESLLIAFVCDIKLSKGDEATAQKLFSKRLHEIFHGELAEQFYRKGITAFYEYRTGKKNFLHTEENLKQHYAEIKNALETQERICERKEPKRLGGTKTAIVPCPQCRYEKRVDAATKRFRCKQCGFNQPYPFQT